jgi:3-oxoadipyl-CoA thiolase
LLNEAFVISAVRTPIGKYGGALKNCRPDDLAALVIEELVRRTGIDPGAVEDVYFGCGNQAGEDNRNIARMAVLVAGLPYTVPGVTVNRLCGSGLEAINEASRAIMLGEGEIFIAGGVESMTRAPFVFAKPGYPFARGDLKCFDTTIGWRFVNPRLAEKYPPLSMGETAENLARVYNISRRDQDEFAVESHRRAVAATESGKFSEEIVPVPIGNGKETQLTHDEGPRPDTTLEKLSRLKPAFAKDGTVTAGNSSGINDGAAAVLMMSSGKARELGLKPLAKVVSSAVAGVDPGLMGLGPVPATKKVLERANLKMRDIDLFEVNEAFAAQVLAVLKEIKIDTSIMNVNGGAIALGHPIGCSGARIVTTLLHEMQRRKTCNYGLATMCIGVGQGIATVFQKIHS